LFWRLPSGGAKEPARPSGYQRHVLKADVAEHVDCKIIRSMLGGNVGAGFTEGFGVLIVVPRKGIERS